VEDDDDGDGAAPLRVAAADRGGPSPAKLGGPPCPSPLQGRTTVLDAVRVGQARDGAVAVAFRTGEAVVNVVVVVPPALYTQ
jgi:hypothetical protein